jgi:adenosylhomocysteine nucleosidase
MFNWLARYLTAQLAERKIRETVIAAAKQHVAAAMSQAETHQNEIHQGPVEIGIVFAIETESGGTEDLLDSPIAIKGSGFTAVRGGLQGRPVVVVRSGVGRKLAARATEALLAGHKPQLVISAGFAGALDKRLCRADVILARDVVDAEGRSLPIPGLVDPARLPQPQRVHVGRLVTVDRIVRLPNEKEALGQKHQALAVDMESLAVVEVCLSHGVPVLVVRAVSDTVDQAIPPDVERLLDQKSAAGRWGAALGAAINRPGSVKDMLQLKENALLATDRLAAVLSAIVIQLTRPTGSQP